MLGDLVVGSLVIPAAELAERYSRSSGPGGQGVNTTDSRVELSWSVASSAALTDDERAYLLERLRHRLVDGVITLAASSERSQYLNRLEARERLARLIRDALRPVRPRKPTRPSRASVQRRLTGKRQRSDLKATRRRPPHAD